MQRVIFLSGIVLMLAMLACNIGAGSPLSADQQAATIVALTLQAQGTPAAGSAILNTPTGSSFTPASSPAMFTVEDNTNCRTGPGVNYELVTTIPAGSSVQLVARYSTGNYWVVVPADNTGICWVFGEFGTASGNFETLPEVTPAVSEGGLPARPGSLFYTYECPFGNLTTTLKWADTANNETGYRVYRYDVLIAELAANSTSYIDTTTITIGGEITYGVEAFNSFGASARRTISFSCR